MAESALEPRVVIGVVTATTLGLFALLGCFAHFRPKNPAVRWFDRSGPFIQIGAFVVILITIIVVIATSPPDVTQAVVPSCFIVWVLLYLFAALRGGIDSFKGHPKTDRSGGDVFIVAHSGGMVDTQHHHHHHVDVATDGHGDGGGGGDGGGY